MGLRAVVVDDELLTVEALTKLIPLCCPEIEVVGDAGNGEEALELIGRHLGMWNDKVQVSGQVETNNPYAGLTTEELRKLIHGG